MDSMGVCQWPGCGAAIDSHARWCAEHRKKQKSVAGVVANRRRREAEKADRTQRAVFAGNPSPCEQCTSLTICRVEIDRPSFWPPCFSCSRHYDATIAARVYKGTVTA